jgi:thiol-disulfide isomerase/thioredoxin
MTDEPAPLPGSTANERRRRPFLRVAQVCSVLLVAGLFALLVARMTEASRGGDLVAAIRDGKKPVAPAFRLSVIWPHTETWPPALRPLVTRKISPADLRGWPVVVNFWASWCIPCKQEAPEVERIWQSFRSKGVVVVGVDTKDFSGDARSFMRHYGLTYPIVRDGDGSLWGPYGVTGVPETRVIDRNGKYVGTQFYGATTATDLRRSIEHALRT